MTLDETIAQHARMLDELSADIRAMERYLRDAGFRLALRVPMGASEELRWCLAEPRRWRIVYASPAYARPLIETASAIRLRARDALPALLRAAGAAEKRPEVRT